MSEGNVTRPIAFVCFGEDVTETKPSEVIVRGILFLISSVFILATLYVYYLIPEWRETQVCISITFTQFIPNVCDSGQSHLLRAYLHDVFLSNAGALAIRLAGTALFTNGLVS